MNTSEYAHDDPAAIASEQDLHDWEGITSRMGLDANPEFVAKLICEIRRLQKLKREKAARIYYQDIVYAVCNIIDRNRGDGKKTVCGTLETPSDEVQKTLAALLANLEPKL